MYSSITISAKGSVESRILNRAIDKCLYDRVRGIALGGQSRFDIDFHKRNSFRGLWCFHRFISQGLIHKRNPDRERCPSPRLIFPQGSLIIETHPDPGKKRRGVSDEPSIGIVAGGPGFPCDRSSEDLCSLARPILRGRCTPPTNSCSGASGPRSSMPRPACS